MSTNPTPQPQAPLNKPFVPDVSAYLANIVADMHAHSVRVSYFFVGIIVLVLAIATGAGYLGLKSYDAQLAWAEAMQTQYVAAVKDFQTQLAQHDAQRATDLAQVASLEAQIAKRTTQPLPEPIKAGLKPDATAEQASLALKTAYNGLVDPQSTPDGKVLTTVKETQLLTTSKVQLDMVLSNFSDQKAIVDLQKGTISSLNNDLTTCKATVAKGNETIDSLKKVVKPSRFKRFLSGAKTAVMVAAAAYLGHKL